MPLIKWIFIQISIIHDNIWLQNCQDVEYSILLSIVTWISPKFQSFHDNIYELGYK